MDKYFINNILMAKNKLLNELEKPTRLEVNVENAKRIAEECMIELSENWNPPPGEKVGELCGIPIYINPDVEFFTIIGSHGHA